MRPVLWWCTAGVPLPPNLCSVPHELHCPLTSPVWLRASPAQSAIAQMPRGGGWTPCGGSPEGHKAHATCTSSPPQVNVADNPKQTAGVETGGPAGGPQPPAHGRAAGTWQAGLAISLRVRVQGPPLLRFPMWRPLAVGDSTLDPHLDPHSHPHPDHIRRHRTAPHRTAPHSTAQHSTAYYPRPQHATLTALGTGSSSISSRHLKFAKKLGIAGLTQASNPTSFF